MVTNGSDVTIRVLLILSLGEYFVVISTLPVHGCRSIVLLGRQNHSGAFRRTEGMRAFLNFCRYFFMLH